MNAVAYSGEREAGTLFVDFDTDDDFEMDVLTSLLKTIGNELHDCAHTLLSSNKETISVDNWFKILEIAKSGYNVADAIETAKSNATVTAVTDSEGLTCDHK